MRWYYHHINQNSCYGSIITEVEIKDRRRSRRSNFFQYKKYTLCGLNCYIFWKFSNYARLCSEHLAINTGFLTGRVKSRVKGFWGFQIIWFAFCSLSNIIFSRMTPVTVSILCSELLCRAYRLITWLAKNQYFLNWHVFLPAYSRK